MRVATWNVNGLRARLDFVRRWLEARRPDVVALQELKVADDQFPHEALAEVGYGSTVLHGQKGWNGVAVLARQPLETVQVGLPGQQDLGARLVSVRAGDLVVTSLYGPNGKHLGHPDFARKLAWLDALAAHLEAHLDPGLPLVLAGDLNVCPGPLDSWNEQQLRGSIFHTDEERGAFRRLLDWGLRDVFRECHPSAQAFSWWDYRGGAFHRKQGLRIDFLLATPPVSSRVRSVEIDRAWRKKHEGLTPSDHAPVVADLD